MQQLKKRFKNDTEFLNSFTKQIEELILKGNVKRSSGNLIKENTWYLPHHCVKHASKPSKARIVFDCSENYGRISLNNRLLCGPVLINQLAGVLIRFRTEEAASMGNIETMYYQL